MPFTPLFGTGFEMGANPFPSADSYSESAEDAIGAYTRRTGSYSWRCRASSWKRFQLPSTRSDIYIANWWYPHYERNYTALMRAYLTSGHYIDVRSGPQYTNYVQAVVNGSVVATSGSVPATGYYIEAYISIADSGGRIIVKVNGVIAIDYTGDTKPSTSDQISYIYWGTSTGDPAWTYYDDLTVGYGDWPSDIRYEKLVPNADTATEQWTPSTGADSYALIDEIPPATGDYISTTTNAQKTIVELEDWTGTSKTPRFVVVWVDAKKDDASLTQIKIIDSDGTNENIGNALNLNTAAGYISKILSITPSSGVWADSDIDSLKIGVESVIP